MTRPREPDRTADFAVRVHRLRSALGLTQGQLAASLSVSRVAVNQWERGLSQPGAAHRVNLERMLLAAGIGTAGATAAEPASAALAARAPIASNFQLAGNTPPSLTSFVGREGELATVTRLLTATRLLTLTGAGGSGKSRLAIEMAARSRAAYA